MNALDLLRETCKGVVYEVHFSFTCFLFCRQLRCYTQGPLQEELNEEVMQHLETLINARLDILEKILKARKRPEVKRQAMRYFEQEEDSEQINSNFDLIINEPRRGK